MKTVLEKFYNRGWLNVQRGMNPAGVASIYPWMSADDRLRAGRRLYRDFYLSGIEATKIPDLIKPRVDGGNNKNLTESQTEHLDSFHKALRVIPAEFYEVVSAIVLDDKDIRLTNREDNRAIRLYNHTIKMKLCMGLDRLAGYYKGKE